MTKDLYNIAPYTEAEAREAIEKLSNHPGTLLISKYLFPDKSIFFLRNTLRSIHSVDEFQEKVMSEAVRWVLDSSVDSFTVSGIENVKAMGDQKFIAMSNHRDIVLDPAFTQYVLLQNGIPLTEIAVGDNLLSSKTVEYLLRVNRMITVIRGISAREQYLSSQVLSKYIRESVTTGRSSVWIAQRQGRTKDGYDLTEQGLLKMFDMSGTKGFEENFRELHILPISISYEYEPCDVRKARELLISRSRKYVKKKNEDTHSIIMGIRQPKGRVHMHFSEPLTDAEIREGAACDRNDRYQTIRGIVSRRIISGYKLWKTNSLCYDLVNGTDKYASHYTADDVASFKKYMEHRISTKVERRYIGDELREIFLRIYANPVQAKEDLGLPAEP